MKGGRQVKQPRANGEGEKKKSNVFLNIKEGIKVSHKHQDREEKFICCVIMIQ